MYQISEDLVKGLINYLSTRPYAEVYQAVQALQGLEKVEKEVGNEDISSGA